MTKIALIDDDPLITKPLAQSLKQQGYDVVVASDGRQGLDLILKEKPDLVLLDIMMPEMDGWAVCRAVREHSMVPIMMLTALNEEVDRILGLEMGADDYLTKPFSSRELLARIKALLRRIAFERQAPAPKVLSQGEITINLDTHHAYRGDVQLELRHKEFELLTLLMSRVGQVVSRAEILDEVWGVDWLGDTRTLDVHIRWLREKIEENPSQPRHIQTVRGVGYRFAPSEAQS